LPKDERERSQLIIELLQRHCNPADLEDEVARLKARVEVLERKMNLT
jgi:ubiquinone biosynthesis protein UbiJ